MSELINKLEAYGADMSGAMERFLDDEELYEMCYQTFLEDEGFENLHEAILSQKYDQAFDAAHSLKGVAANMGLIPIYDDICVAVEALRAKDYSDLENQWEKIANALELLKSM